MIAAGRLLFAISPAVLCVVNCVWKFANDVDDDEVSYDSILLTELTLLSRPFFVRSGGNGFSIHFSSSPSTTEQHSFVRLISRIDAQFFRS